jgi:hypothetical protein
VEGSAFAAPKDKQILRLRDLTVKSEITIKAEGEMYDRDLPDFIDVEAARERMEDTGEKPE